MANYEYVTDTGTILPDTADLQSLIIAEFREAFGPDLVVTPDTPQGVLIVAETLARDTVVRNLAALANQINPDLAGGVFLDALWALTGGSRVRATPSLIPGAVLTGVPGTIVPAGSLASLGPLGAQFQLAGDVLIPVGGSATGDFQSMTLGAVGAPIGALDTIVSGVLGWESVTNPTPAITGQDEESDAAARRRRRQTLALQSVALPEAIISGVFDVEGVRSVLLRENVTAAPVVIDGITIPPHSIYVAVAGGTDLDVATELLARKSLGAGWAGDTTVDVTEPTSGQVYPVTFQRPTEVQVFASVTVFQGSEVADPAAAVRDAILAYAAGEQEGENGFVIGGHVSSWELAGAVNRAAPGLFVQECLVGLSGGSVAPGTLTFGIDELPVIFPGNIGVTLL